MQRGSKIRFCTLSGDQIYKSKYIRAITMIAWLLRE